MPKNSSKGQKNTDIEKILRGRKLPKNLEFKFDEGAKRRPKAD